MFKSQIALASLCLIVFVILFAGLGTFVLAGTTGGSGTETTGGSGDDTTGSGSFPVLSNPLKAGSISDLLANLLDAITQIGIVVVTCSIIYSGFQYATAQGNVTKINKAHTGLSWALVGSAIIIGSYAIAQVVHNTLNQVLTT